MALLSFILAREQAPQQIAAFFLGIADGPITFLIAVNLMIFVLGCFIEALVILLIVVPILVPIAAGFGIRTPEQAAKAAREADAVVVGSALVATLKDDPSGKTALRAESGVMPD